MTAADRLAAIEARANAATEGPWDVASDADTYLKPTDVVGPGEPGERFIICEYAGQDAEFIAHARADVPALVAALRAVLDEVAECRRAADANEPIAARGGWQAFGYMKACRRTADRLEAAIDQHLGGES